MSQAQQIPPVPQAFDMTSILTMKMMNSNGKNNVANAVKGLTTVV